MINNLIKKFNEPEKKRLFDNIFSLFILQGANYVLPLLTIPYLVRTIGIEYFGLLAFATATIGYFTLITDYGFNLSATRQISIHRDSNEQINEIFSSVINIKIIFTIFTFFILCILVFFVEKFKEHWEIYFLTFGIVIGQSLFPIWLFQGIEKMWIITFLNIIAKFLFVIFIFIFVKEKEDYFLVPLFSSLSSILIGVLSIYLSYKLLNIKLKITSLEAIKYQLKEGWHIFTSTIYISLYTSSTIIILGLFTNNTIVGYFSAIEKIIQAIKGLYQPISQALYPLLSKKFNENKKAGENLLNVITKYCGGSILIISTIIFIFSKEIVNFVYGDTSGDLIKILKIMSFIPLIVTLNNIIGTLLLIANGYSREVNYLLKFSSFLHITYAIPLIYLFNTTGAAISSLITETIVLFLFINLSKKIKNTKA